jgi:hypothetical protein
MFEKRPRDYYALWAVAILSLLLNLYLINTLLTVRRQTAVAFADAANTVEALKAGVFDYTVTVNQTIPIAAKVPIDFKTQVPIKEIIPIDTTVAVPLDFPIVGRRTIEVPISTRIPLDLTVEVPIQQTIPLAVNVPVKLDVPIRIRIADTPLAGALDDIQTALADLAAGLGGGQSASTTPTATP